MLSMSKLLNFGLFSSSAKVSGFLEYQLWIKGTVLYLSFTPPGKDKVHPKTGHESPKME
jgi:hypothetical protein